MGEPTSCCRSDGGYCDRCDLLLGLEGLVSLLSIATTAAR
jgi:hypothetical protein